MAEHKKSPYPPQHRYPDELKARAVRLVHEAVAEAGGESFGVIGRIARPTRSSFKYETSLSSSPIVFGSRPFAHLPSP